MGLAALLLRLPLALLAALALGTGCQPEPPHPSPALQSASASSLAAGASQEVGAEEPGGAPGAAAPGTSRSSPMVEDDAFTLFPVGLGFETYGSECDLSDDPYGTCL